MNPVLHRKGMVWIGCHKKRHLRVIGGEARPPEEHEVVGSLPCLLLLWAPPSCPLSRGPRIPLVLVSGVPVSDKVPGQLETLPRGLSDAWKGRQPLLKSQHVGGMWGWPENPAAQMGGPSVGAVPQPSCGCAICVSCLSLPVESHVDGMYCLCLLPTPARGLPPWVPPSASGCQGEVTAPLPRLSSC